ncbi:MAG: hypothetical protein HZA91_15960 [Verrucomicrobia bacterium]|nr:hypothetical protein [Verrucomicrobiota bacterium]
MNADSRTDRLHELENEIERLRSEQYAAIQPGAWAPSGYYTMFHVLAGSILGMVGAAASLFFNVVGSLVVGQHPLQIIRVYLTFPLGERALSMESGLVPALGCCLYLATGALYGVGFHLVMSRWFANAAAPARLGVATALGLGLWGINYYAILSWLQPMCFGGTWIVQLIPWWVGALTHLVFAWTMLAIEPWAKFEPYRHRE